MELNPIVIAQATKSPLPVAPSTDQIYILPSPASQSQPKTPEAPSTKTTPSMPILQNFWKLVAIVQNFSTTSKNFSSCLHCMAQRLVRVPVRILLHLNLGISKLSPPPPPPPPTFCFNFSCFISFYRILFRFL